MSWVFLTDDQVYKLKKPVRYPFLDLSTLERRAFNCREELRLNRRLARDVYLDVVPLTLDTDGALAICGDGRTVDWLVVMRRLPDELLLDHAIASRSVHAMQIGTVAELLARFYRSCTAADLSASDYVAHFRRQHDINAVILFRDDFTDIRDQARAAFDHVSRALETHRSLLEERVRQGRIVEGHGDLRPEHICLTQPPVIIDCLEFDRTLRLVDPFDEIAFLGLECAILGADWIGNAMRSDLAASLADTPPEEVSRFYRAYRGCLRARLALAHLLEPAPRTPEKWLPLAGKYLAAALPAGPG